MRILLLLTTSLNESWEDMVYERQTFVQEVGNLDIDCYDEWAPIIPS